MVSVASCKLLSNFQGLLLVTCLTVTFLFNVKKKKRCRWGNFEKVLSFQSWAAFWRNVYRHCSFWLRPLMRHLNFLLFLHSLKSRPAPIREAWECDINSSWSQHCHNFKLSELLCNLLHCRLLVFLYVCRWRSQVDRCIEEIFKVD